jgi:hypothetical protein
MWNSGGAVYVFTRTSPNTWSQVRKIVPSVLGLGFEFGYSLSYDINRIAIGAPGATKAGGELPIARNTTPPKILLFVVVCGAVYTFAPDTGGGGGGGGGWTEKSTIASPDCVEGDRFGQSLHMVGANMSVGAPAKNSAAGVGYVFTLVSNSWTSQRTMSPALAGSRFGCSTQLAAGGTPVLFGSCNEGWCVICTA